MTTEKLYLDGAEEILNRFDENPTAPFTIERKWAVERLAMTLQAITDKAADEDEAAYQAGYDEGTEEGRYQAEQDYEDRIAELETEIDDLRNELEDAQRDVDNAFAEGYEAASRGHGSNETLELK